MAASRFLRASPLHRTCRPVSTLSVLFLSRQSDHPFLNHEPLFSTPSWQSSRSSSSFFNGRLFASISSESGIKCDSPSPELGFHEIPGGINDDSSLPVLTVVYLLDGFHQLTGLPWWMVIASSTVAVRLALLPLLVLQLKKLKRISELLPPLPTPFPPPLSARRFIDHFSHFLKERRAIGCPSFLWFFPYLSIQIPCFFLLMTGIRRMSLDSYPGFDSVQLLGPNDVGGTLRKGGALWFQDLTAFPNGVHGLVFPSLIASLHYINVQISFEASTVRQTTSLLVLFIRYYKLYLEILSLPLLFVGYALPHGSLFYWVTNSSLSVIQQLSLKHPAIIAKLGLLDAKTPLRAEDSAEINKAVLTYTDSHTTGETIYLQNQTPEELLALSVQLLSKGDRETSIHLLQLALEKDPGYVRGLVLMGQALLQKMQLLEATEYLEHAISKLSDGHASDVEDVDLLMLASQWAGAAYVQQGNMKRGMIHLERVANFKEPNDVKSKAHYFDALLLLSSALYKEGRRAEAAKYLHLVVAYNPAYKYLLEQCDEDNDLVGDLASSRRGH